MSQQTILPQDPAEAVSVMIEITRRMLSAMQGEASAIARQSEAGMLDVEVFKEKLLPMYQMAAEEFAGRIEDFRDVSPSLLSELQSVQDELGNAARENQFNLAS